jgi:tetratricopeptide (TPR) repeat protein
MVDKRIFGLALLTVVLVTLVSLYPVVRNGFVNWDDARYLVENEAITSLTPAHVARIFSTFYVGAYVPLTALSYAVEFHFFSLRPRPYHVTNLVLHLCNCLLVFLLAYGLSRSLIAALITALLFGVHPLHVESVAWITERKDMLYGFFFLAACLAYLGYAVRGKMSAYFTALVLIILSGLAKPTAAVFPFILLVLDFLLKRRFRPGIFLEKIPFFVISCATLIVAYAAQRSTGAFTTGLRAALPATLYQSANNLFFYVFKTVLPLKLSCLYPEPRWWFAPLVVAGLAALAIWSLRRTRVIAFGGLFLLVGLLPMLQLVRVGQPLADRYTYLALFGLFYIGGYFLAQAVRGSGWPRRIILFLVTASIVIVCGTLSHRQTRFWKDGVALWTNTINNYPNLPLAYNNRGNAYCYLDENRRALLDYDRALVIKPDYADAYNNRGNAWRGLDEYGRAIDDYSAALRYNPELADAYYNRAVVRFLEKDYRAVLSDLKKYEGLGGVVPPEFYRDLQRVMPDRTLN